MNHDPDISVRSFLNLHEMISASQRPDLVQSTLIFLRHDRQIALSRWHKRLILFFLVMIKSYRDRFMDDSHDFLQIFFIDLRQAGPAGAQPTTDIHPDRIGDDRTSGSPDGTERHTISPTRIWLAAEIRTD